ncbi:hypothetical protein D3OALGB2SA_2798 [Olavius algarvensis associated proteobacterium Delta 3]|nr:hypothetical protein D3OALGB2SA_2798 [Olavius algarvensis associated proteobacterium Delta 3]
MAESGACMDVNADVVRGRGSRTWEPRRQARGRGANGLQKWFRDKFGNDHAGGRQQGFTMFSE